ncbi:YraN family protein [Psychrobacter sp. DAB_AL62B]|uniref:YraN family protein n=1 Tax=Psychrobacter sp. DAB_AL62B TaxID=1028420 RepID=UPI00238147CA|nr:YraN family protein [Psychrobacter sp. DAB_AL62B]MDE4455860.1 YraN family protein [Psychrobacter sp. DAB_AL62B]
MLCYDNSEMLSRPIDVMVNDKPLTLTSPKQRQGSRFEQQACEFLRAQGLILIAQNWQQPKVGELDLVMLEKGQAWSTLVFVEVRQRQRSEFGDAALSVTASKQRKIIKAARYFLQQHPKYNDYECRFDVMAYNTIDNNHNSQINNIPKTQSENVQPEWLKGAFIAAAW